MIESIPYVLTGVGIIVSILYYTSVLRNANTTRQAQLFMQILNQWNQPSMVESRVWYFSLELNTLEDYARLWREPEAAKLLRVWGGFLDGIGVLVREGFLDIKVIAGLMGGVVKMHWEYQAPYVYEMRESMNSPRFWIEWEYLYTALMKYAEDNPERSIQDVKDAGRFRVAQ